MDVLIISQSDKEVGLGHFEKPDNSERIKRQLQNKALLAIFTDLPHYEFFSDLNIVSLEKSLEIYLLLLKNHSQNCCIRSFIQKIFLKLKINKLPN